MVRRTALAETMSAYLVKEISKNSRISVRSGSRVVDGGGARLPGVAGPLRRARHRRAVPADGLFLLLGADPACDWLPAEVALDDRGFVLTGRDIPRPVARRAPPPHWRPRCRGSSRRGTSGPAP